MKSSHFVDVDGLPDPQHYTTARDLATIANALIRDFPEYYYIFSMKDFTWNKIKQPNRNGLLWTDPSVDGLKTGHTDEAGYCLIASARRNDTRLISVVLQRRSGLRASPTPRRSSTTVSISFRRKGSRPHARRFSSRACMSPPPAMPRSVPRAISM